MTKNLPAVVFIIALVLSSSAIVNAQANKVDSIIIVLNKIDVNNKIDTPAFTAIAIAVESIQLNDTLIPKLEQAANGLKIGNNEYWRYLLKFSIMNSLVVTDKKKSIDYGEVTFEEAKKSKTPHADYISFGFLRQERIPYRNSNLLQQGLQVFTEKLKAYKEKNDTAGLVSCYYVLSGFYRYLGLLDQGIYNMKKAVSYAHSDTSDTSSFPFFDPVGNNFYYNNLAVLASFYIQKEDYSTALQYAYRAFDAMAYHTNSILGNSSTYIAQCKLMLSQLDSVQYYLNYTFNYKGNADKKDYLAFALQVEALYNIQTGNYTQAEQALNRGRQMVDSLNLPPNARPGLIAPDYYRALLRIQQNRIDDAISLLAKDIQRLAGVRLERLRDYKLMANLYNEKGDYKQSAQTWHTYNDLFDTLQKDQSKFGSINFETEQQLNAKELSINSLTNKNKLSAIVRNFMIGIAVLVLLLAALIYYRFKTKQKDNKILQQTLNELKSTQQQLIQSEKMASLGELTAGIAHEIQNPLNFVNNFSEVNQELISELVEEVEKGNTEEVKAIANDIKENEEKINHHGKRADAIVKGMLQHSRQTSGTKEPTDINALCDEYLRLSYHGLRVKDKNFNADFKTAFDESIGKINIVPQDIGRVLLNLYNNAFYAVNEKKKKLNGTFSPVVNVSTKKENGNVVIKVSDNGNGIPQNIIDKIFQPFFTTKPTGEGTGLGLSLAYDIMKAHGGEIKVETKQNEGSMFIITLAA